MKVTPSTEYINHLNKTVGKEFLHQLLSNQVDEEFIQKIEREIEVYDRSARKKIESVEEVEEPEEDQDRDYNPIRLKSNQSTKGKTQVYSSSKDQNRESRSKNVSASSINNNNTNNTNKSTSKGKKPVKKTNMSNSSLNNISSTSINNRSKSGERNKRNSSNSTGKVKAYPREPYNNDNFENSLRKYQTFLNSSSTSNSKDGYKYFNNYTTPYGKYFDRNLLKDISGISMVENKENKERIDKSMHSQSQDQGQGNQNIISNNNNIIKVQNNEERFDTKQSHSLFNEKGGIESTIEDRGGSNYNYMHKEIPWKLSNDFIDTEDN